MIFCDYAPVPEENRISFNHAMIYVSSIPASLQFYEKQLGFQLLERQGDGYARLKSGGSDTTIALHKLPEGSQNDANGRVRLYFEVDDIEQFCEKLTSRGVVLDEGPAVMPWGWSHAYLRDTDGNEISVYRAGALRLMSSN